MLKRGTPSPIAGEIESALVLHYGRLVRLAYAVLPATGDRHRRVLSAHATVQRVLPSVPQRLRLRLGARRAVPPLPAPRGAAAVVGGGGSGGESRGSADQAPVSEAYTEVRRRVLAAAMRSGPRALFLLPRAWGLRLFPLGGGTEELALARALAELSTAERAAYALLTLESVSVKEVAPLLTGAGAAGASGALRTARRLLNEHPRDALRSPEFDPCTLRTRPTDLVQRRSRSRWVAGGLVCAVAVSIIAGSVFGGGSGDGGSRASDSSAAVASGITRAGTGTALTVASLVRVSTAAWRSTARIDFTAWPARGGEVADQGLLAQALAAWAAPQGSVIVHVGGGTTSVAPAVPPHLLWAGALDGATVVLLDDGTRLARYTRPDHPDAADPVRLDVTRSDDSDVTSAGAVLLRSSGAGDRFLIAPWVDTVELRDLRAPNTPARSVTVTDGVTGALPAPAASGCGASWPVLQLRSSTVIAEHHAFLLTDLGDVTAAHLTYTPPPQRGPAESPREATGSDALVTWARLACGLASLREQDVKQVNAWEFAQQTLPEDQGSASWVCTRADHWDGTGAAATSFLAPGAVGAPGVVTAVQPEGRACSRFEQYVLADTRWRSSSTGREYLLAAGSRHVSRITASGASASGQTMATPAASAATANVTAVLDTGEVIHPIG